MSVLTSTCTQLFIVLSVCRTREKAKQRSLQPSTITMCIAGPTALPVDCTDYFARSTKHRRTRRVARWMIWIERNLLQPPTRSVGNCFVLRLITGSDTSIPAVCYACWLWCPLPCHKWVWLNWYLSTLGWIWKASITAMSCCHSRCFQQSSMSQNVVYSQNNMLFMAKLVIFVFCDFPRSGSCTR